MRGKRAKQYRKLMHQYQLAFAFREPYQVLLDAGIIKAAAHFKMRLGALLAGTLHGQIKPMITQCCIRHLYDDDNPDAVQKQAWIDVAKSAERRRCGHHERARPLSALDCLRSVVDPKAAGANRHRYVVASQDADVRRAMRAVAGVPLVYIARSVMILEPMAQRSEEVKERDERGKIRAGLKGRRGGAGAEAGEKRKREDDEGSEGDERQQQRQQEVVKKRRIKGPKEPNPLSVKKSKKDAAQTTFGQRTEAERAAIRAASKRDPQAAEKAVDPEIAAGEDADGVVEGQRKRKRKRKPKEGTVGRMESLLEDEGSGSD